MVAVDFYPKILMLDKTNKKLFYMFQIKRSSEVFRRYQTINIL